MDLVWDFTSLLFYIGIVFSIFILSFFIKFKSHSDANSFNYFILAIIFLIYFIVSSIRNVGTDLPTYLDIFSSSNSNSDSEVYGIEPGFLLLNRVIYQFSADGELFVIIITFLFLILVFFSIFYYKNELDFPIVFLSFSTLYYFQSFSLIRVYLASALLLFSIKYLLLKRFFIFFLWFLVISSIHYSTVLLILPLMGIFIYRFNKLLFFVYLLSLFLTIYSFSNYLILFNLTNRYTGYLENIDKTNSVGFGQFFFHLPLIYLIYYVRKINIFNEWQITIFIVFTLFSFFFGMLGYWIPTLSRVNYLLSFIFLIFVPISLKAILSKRNGYFTYVGFLVYLLVQFYIYFSALAFADGINSYSTIFSK